SHLSLLLRGHRHRRVAPIQRYGQQLRDKRDVARQICRRWFEQRRQLVELHAGTAVWREARRLRELRNKWMERGARLVRRAEIAEASMGLAFDSGQQAFGDTRLADAGLAGEQYDSPLARLGLLPTAQQQVHLFPAADKRSNCASAPRLE